MTEDDPVPEFPGSFHWKIGQLSENLELRLSS